MSAKYQEYNGLNLPEVTTRMLAKWEREHTFERSIETRDENKPFVFFEGPPSANGLPGIHHVMARSLKDIFCRYKTLQGFQVKRKAGWDTHGLPVELGVEKELGIKIVFLGFGLDSDKLHSPNEKYNVANYYKGIETIPYFHQYFTELQLAAQ